MKTHPLSAKGKYYIDTDNCYCCNVCEFTAPNNFKTDGDELVSFVIKQPENTEEEKLCREAMLSCPHETIFDDGK
jgi:ferredoxin